MGMAWLLLFSDLPVSEHRFSPVSDDEAARRSVPDSSLGLGVTWLRIAFIWGFSVVWMGLPFVGVSRFVPEGFMTR